MESDNNPPYNPFNEEELSEGLVDYESPDASSTDDSDYDYCAACHVDPRQHGNVNVNENAHPPECTALSPLNVEWNERPLDCTSCKRVQPNMRVYNCRNKHLICTICLLYPADTIMEFKPKCPICEESVVINIKAWKLINEMLVKCQFCDIEFKNEHLKKHETEECGRRIVKCKNHIIGCNWCGPFAEKENHEQDCEYLKKTGAEIFDATAGAESAYEMQKNDLDNLIRLLNHKYCTVLNIRLLRKDGDGDGENSDTLHLESQTFTVKNLLFFIAAKIERGQGTNAGKFVLSYAIQNVTTLHRGQRVFYAALGDVVDLKFQIFEYFFHSEGTKSDYKEVATFDSDDKFKNSKTPITFRLIVSFK